MPVIYPDFEVDADCIKCKLCTFIAEDNFEINPPDMAIVKKQPESEPELKLCKEAEENCPVDSISH